MNYNDSSVTVDLPKTVIRSAEGVPGEGQHRGGQLRVRAVLVNDLSGSYGRAGHISGLARTHAADRRSARGAGSVLHDEGRGVGGLLHLRSWAALACPSDVTDNTLSSVLVVLTVSSAAVLGNARAARRHSCAHPGSCVAPDRSRRAHRNVGGFDSSGSCRRQNCVRHQMTRRAEPVRVCFQPFEGRVWISRQRAGVRLSRILRAPAGAGVHRMGLKER